MHPTGYQLRQLDLGNRTVSGDVRRVDEDETGVMQGIARTHTMAATAARLYTLYTVAGQRAFVHVLDLRDKYAHCVDLPLPFGTGPQSAVALAMSPDGYAVVRSGPSQRRHLRHRHDAVDDRRHGDAPLAGSNGPASGVMGPDGSLYLASENHVIKVVPLSLDYQSSTEVPGRVTALGMAPDGNLVARRTEPGTT